MDDMRRTTQEIQGQIETLGVVACQDPNACAEDVLKNFNDNGMIQPWNTLHALTAIVSKSLQLQLAVNQDRDALPQIMSVMSQMSRLIDSVENAASTPLNTEGLVRMITDGTITKLSDIVQVLQITKDLPNLVKDLHENMPTVTEFTVALNQRAQAISESISGVVSDSWTQQAAASSDAIRQNIVSIQSRFRDQIAPTITDIRTRVAAVQSLLSTLQFNGGVPTTDIKVASYQRWSPVSMNMPCSRWTTKKYEVAGITDYFGYPQFYNCLYEATIAWPNHHIPYVKVQFS